MNWNNKNNNNYRARGIAASRCNESSPLRFSISDIDMLKSAMACQKNKTSSLDEIRFEMKGGTAVLGIVDDMNAGTYSFIPASAFVLRRPVPREVLAAAYRDRVRQTWEMERMERILEGILPTNVTANRKGGGCLYATNRVFELFDAYPDGWVAKFDLQGFFMSVDKNILLKLALDAIDLHYEGEDKEALAYYVKDELGHRVQNDCKLRCSPKEWRRLPAHKSMFTQPEGRGLPIGNLPSQVLVQFLLKEIVDFIEGYGLGVVDFADDFVTVGDKGTILRMMGELRRWLASELHLTLHPAKFYMQPVRHGVTFGGYRLSPGRRIIGKRTERRALAKAHWICSHSDTLPPEKAAATLNSYLGRARYCEAGKMVKGIREELEGSELQNILWYDWRRCIVRVRTRERLKRTCAREVIRMRKQYNRI